MRAMISQPMGGLSRDEIQSVRNSAVDKLQSMGYEVLDTLYDEDLLSETASVNRGLWFLAMSLLDMAKCDAVYFCKGWEKARGCRIENQAAASYGLTQIYQD